MNRRFRISTLVFYGLSIFTVVIAVICFAKALTWIGKPFAGFLTYPSPFASSFSSRDWPGKLAGLNYMDRIRSADGKTVWLGQDVVDVVKDKKPGTQIQYVLETEGETRELAIAVDTFELKDFFVAFSITYLYGLIVFSLGVIVFLLKPNTRTSWVFFIMCFGLGIYGITGFECQSTFSFTWLNGIVLSIFPFCFIHLGLIFPEKKRILIRWPVIEYLIYLPSLILAIAYQIYFIGLPSMAETGSETFVPLLRPLSAFARIFTLLGFVSLILLVLYSYFKSSTIEARQRARMMIFGVAVAFLPVGILMLLAFTLKVFFPFNFVPFFTIFFPIFIAYSIVRHNLFDADLIIRRTVGYALVTAIVIGAYSLVTVTFNVFMGQYELAQSKAFPILFTIGIIFVFNPLRNRVQAIVDRIFFRKEYDYGEIVEKVGGAMTTMLELPQILKELTQTFIDDMFISTSSVLLLTPDGQQYHVSLADGEKRLEVENKTFKRDDPIIGIIEAEKRELTKYDVLEDPKYKDVSEGSAANFDALYASLMVPLVYQDQVIGSLNFGDKKSGKPFNREDIDLLRTLAHQGAVAIENARLFQENLEKQRMEEELNIARDLQMSMLPAECPTIEGLDIAAYSVSAREVGGDFYDFIDMGEDKAGFVIGDVTGKSVSGALVMSASRSVFRMLSEEEMAVSESMMRANRRLKKDVKTGMFVALLFAVLNSKHRSVTLCSAGQTQPIHFSSKTGEVKLVETKGDTFPLGILEDVSYEETLLQLEPGDKVIFYTDGIVEAMDEKEEIYGFERLQDVVQEASAMDADSLLKEILDKVNAFAGEAAQHDDITVIVVSVA